MRWAERTASIAGSELVLASLRGPKTISELCREHDISDSLLRMWREQLLAAGAERLSGKAERTETTSCAGRSRGWSAPGAQDDGGRDRGGTLAGMGVRMRVGRVVLAVARANPTDGTRMVAALAGRELGAQVNRKRVQRLMREHRLLQRRRSEGRRRRPGFFCVERPDQLWHLDMTSVWVAEHGWCDLNAAIDCCTREITAWALDVRCRVRRRSPSSSRRPPSAASRPGG
jgi:hypothetical protein